MTKYIMEPVYAIGQEKPVTYVPVATIQGCNHVWFQFFEFDIAGDKVFQADCLLCGEPIEVTDNMRESLTKGRE